MNSIEILELVTSFCAFLLWRMRHRFSHELPGGCLLPILLLVGIFSRGSVQADDARVVLEVPASVVEGAGTLTNAAKVGITTAASSNTVVSLSSGNPLITIPAEVMIPANSSNAFFDIVVGDDLLVEPDRPFQLTAIVNGSTASADIILKDNDPYRIQFGPLPAFVDTNTSYVLQLTALNQDGSVQTNFSLRLSLLAEDRDGNSIPLEPAVVSFSQGRAAASLRSTMPGSAVRIRCLGYQGLSDAFNVVLPAFYSVSQTVADIAWHAASQTLFATVPASASNFANCIVAIDPATGQVAKAYPVGSDPGRMEMSPSGGYLYFTLSNRLALQRFDLTTRTAGLQFGLDGGAGFVNTVAEFCVPPNLPDSVVILEWSDNTLQHTTSKDIKRYDYGVGTLLPELSAIGASQSEPLDKNYDVVLSSPLARANALAGSITTISTNATSGTVVFRGGRLYDTAGNLFSADTFSFLGRFPNVMENAVQSLVEVNPDLRRVFFLSGFFNCGSSSYKLKTYDGDLLHPLSELSVPHTSSSPTRFLRLGTNGLAYVMGDGQLWFVRPDIIQPSSSADLSLSVSATAPVAEVGTDYPVIITVSNAGPDTASFIRITNTLPALATVANIASSAGNFSVTNGALTWVVAPLPPGSNAVLHVSLRFVNAGWQANTVCALGFEPDPVYSNNAVALPLYVQLPPAATGIFAVNCSSEDMIYDPVRDRFLLSVGDSISSQSNGLAIFNQYSGTVESFTSLGKRPGKIVPTPDGRQLYVSLSAAGQVRRLDMATFSQDLEFTIGSYPSLGGSMVYPLFARDMVVTSGDSNSVVIARADVRVGVDHDVALYQNGVLRTNVVAGTLLCDLECDTNTGTVFGLNAITNSTVCDLWRFNITADGLSIAESYPRLSSDTGRGLKYAAGRFFTTAGRSLRTSPFGVDRIYAGAEKAVLVEPDANYGRVFYLSASNTTASLLACDMNTWRQIGSLSITNLAGTPTTLIRWGTNGLAFRTTSNLLYVIRHPLVQPSAESHLAISLTQTSSTTAVDNEVRFTLTLANSGPAGSSPMQIPTTVSPGGVISAPSAALGTWINAGTNLLWSVPGLTAGSQTSISFSLKSAQTGMVTVVSSLPSGLVDSEIFDNTAIALLNVGPVGGGAPIVLSLPVRDVLWAASLGKFYMTASPILPNGDGLLLSLDPQTLRVSCEAQMAPGAGRLALGSDGSRIHAVLTYGIEERVLPGAELVRRYLLGNLGAPETASDIDSLPGSSGAIAVLHGVYSYNTNVMILDNGVARTNAASCYKDSSSEVLEISDDATRLYVQNSSAGGFQRYAVDATGTTLIDSDTTLFPPGSLQIVYGAGLIYSSGGRVVNPSNRTIVGTMASVPTNSRLLYDRASDRVLFISPGGILRAYDGPSLMPVGTEMVAAGAETPTSFIQWGADRLAFSTTNRLVLFRTPMVPTNAPADIAISLFHGTGSHIVGSNIIASIVITNSGPNPANGVIWTDSLPVGFSILDARASLGACTISSNVVSGVIPQLGCGGEATVSIVFEAPAAGIVTNQVTCFSTAVDPVFENNTASALLWVQPSTGLPSTLTLNLPIKDIERDPVRPLLYASFGSTAGPLADSVVAIDPVSGSFGKPVRVGSDPGVLCASPDGQFLYVGLDGSASVQKLALPTLSAVSSFPVPKNERVLKMVVSPKDPNVVVIRRTPGAKTGLFVDGVQRPNELKDQDLFAFSESTGELFGCNAYTPNVKLYRLDTGSSGLALLDGQPAKPGLLTDLKSSGGLIFYSRGMVLDPNTATVTATMPVRNGLLVEPDTSCGRVFHLTASGTNRTLCAFDIEQGIEVGSTPVPPLASAPRRLIRWGANGLAACNTNSQVVIWRGVMVPTNPAIDVVISQSAAVASVITNSSFTVSMQLTNAGPVPAAGLVVTQEFSIPVANVSITTTCGSASWTNNVLTWRPGALDTGTVASLQVSLKALKPGTLNVMAYARHDHNDRFWGDNFALTAVNVTTPVGTNVIQLRLAATEMKYDPYRDVIYASTPASNKLSGNLVAIIDPNTGNLNQVLRAGSEPAQEALSSDGKYLYVALSGALGVQRFDLSTAQRDLSFNFDTNKIFYAQDLEVHPTDPDIAVVTLAQTVGYPGDVVVYNHGVQLPLKGGGAQGLIFSSDGSELFGSSPGTSAAILRMRLGTDGVSSQDWVLGFTRDPSDLKFCNGRLYSSSGQVVDSTAGVLLTTLPANGPVAVDSSAPRAFFLAQKSTEWELRAFELTTFEPAGTQVVAGVLGTPANLIRCGPGRLAFRTSSNQLFIVRSSLATTNPVPAADLAVTQRAEQDFSAPTETLRFRITVTNQGPVIASNITVAIRPPSPVAAISLSCIDGASTTTDGNYVCTLPFLEPGASTELVLSTVITNTLTCTNFVSVTSASPDPVSADNTSRLGFNGVFFQRSDTYTRIPAASTALAYDPVRRRLLVGMANTLAWYDPETGSCAGQMSIGLTPTIMVVSDDAQYLYAYARSTRVFRRIHLPSMTTNLNINIPGAGIVAMAAIPNSPHSIALTYWASNRVTTAVFDDNIARPSKVADLQCTILACSSDATSLFGYASTGIGGDSPDVFRMTLNNTGLVRADNGPSDTPSVINTEMVFAANRLFFASGHIMNPWTWTEETPLDASGTCIAVAPGADRIATMTSGSTGDLRVRVFSLSTRTRLADLSFGSISDNSNLVYCGADRWAFRTPSMIYLVRSSSTPVADLTLRSSSSANEVMPGESVSLQLAISNSGPAAVSNAVVTNTLPPGFSLVSTHTSSGSIVVQGQTVVCNLGSLASNATALVTLNISPAAHPLGCFTNSAILSAAGAPDPVEFNNRSDLPLFVIPLDSDRDGIPDEYEIAHGLNPTNAIDATLDFDCDGASNLQEYQAGADPMLFENVRLTAVEFEAGAFEFSVHGALGKLYTLESSADLTNWSVVAAFRCTEQNSALKVEGNPVGHSFFRLRTDTTPAIPLLSVENVSVQSSNATRISVIAPPGRRYSLQASSDFVQWTEFTNFFGSSCVTVFTDPTGAGSVARYYRVVVP